MKRIYRKHKNMENKEMEKMGSTKVENKADLTGMKRINVKQIKGKSKQALAAVLGGSLVFGMTGAGAYAAGMRKDGNSGPEIIATETADQEKTRKNTEDSVEETVYVIAGADGTAQKIIVSDWMKSENGEDTYTQESLKKELPVDMAVSYKLDGKAVAASDMAGKSGSLTMRFDYTNKQYEEVEINGQKKRVYVPFVMLTGMVLDNERFSDVKVSNGRVVSDGDRTMVVGFAMPGLQESLDLDKEKLELPEYVEVTANVKDFELETTMTLATTEIFENLDLDEADTLEELDESMDQLTDAMDQLTDGSSALYDGLTELSEKSGDLISGINQLADGASALVSGAGGLKVGAGDLKTGAGTLKTGADDLKTGAGDLKTGAGDLKTGVGDLKTGAETLKAGTGGLKAGADDLKTGAEALKAGAGEVKTGAEALKAGAGEVKTGAEDLKTGVEGLKQGTEAVGAGALGLQAGASELKEGLEQLASNSSSITGGAGQVFDSLLATASARIQPFGLPALDRNNYNQVLDMAISAAAGDPGLASQLQGAKDQLNSYSQFYQGLVAYTAGVDSANEGAGRLASGAADLVNGTDSLIAGAGQLSDGAGRLSDGAGRLESGIGQLSDGAGQLSDGADQLAGGVNRLSDGAGQLSDGAGRLEDGAGRLYDGAGQLSDGAGKLYDGAGQLTDGAGQLAGGMDTLKTGIGRLQNGSGALVDGVEQLKDGAMQLSDGIKEFDEEGIQVLVDAFDGDIKELKDRMTAVSDVAKRYKSFKDDSGNHGQSVRFIYKTEKIGNE